MYKLVILMFLMRNVLGIRKNALGNVTSVITSSNAASVNFFQTIAKGNENVLFCPLSLNILLALVTIAAGRGTAKQLKSALHLNIDNKDIESGYKKLLENLKDENLKIATRIFPAITADILAKFIKTARQFFNSKIESVNYNDPGDAARIINTFVEKNTNNKIHDIVSADSLSEGTLLLLVNAVHFKDDWKYKFKSPMDGDFYLSKDKKVKTKMMEVTSDYGYAEITSLDARVLQIPYKRKGYSMLIILPNKIDGIHDVVNKLNLISFEEIYNKLYIETDVKLTMPKFKMEQTLKLVEVCKQLGIKSMFEPTADLSGLSEDSIHVSDIIQKTFIQVDEKGVEAAAATAIYFGTFSMGSEPHPIVFTADHPFIFVLMKDKMVLFLGRLCKI